MRLELVAGTTLHGVLHDEPTPVRWAAELVETLARAMDHVHRQGIVHRDLKPGNILLASGVPKITDFGLAKLYEGPDSKMTRAPIGTPHYMSPEQAMGHGENIGPLADVYGLGTILYELLTGQPPFQGNTVLEILNCVAHPGTDAASPGTAWRPARSRNHLPEVLAQEA